MSVELGTDLHGVELYLELICASMLTNFRSAHRCLLEYTPLEHFGNCNRWKFGLFGKVGS